MNVRRINASEEFSNMGKLILVILLLMLLLITSTVPQSVQKNINLKFWEKRQVYKMTDYSCNQIKELNGTVYKDSTNRTFDKIDVLLYYELNCVEVKNG